jgi:hypothetical protein
MRVVRFAKVSIVATTLKRIMFGYSVLKNEKEESTITHEVEFTTVTQQRNIA